MAIRFAALYATHPLKTAFSHRNLSGRILQVPAYGFEFNYAVGSVPNRVRTDVGSPDVVLSKGVMFLKF